MAFKFNIRYFQKEDLNIMNKFLVSWNFPVVTPQSLEFLPPTGVIVFFEEIPICMGFLIKCDNKTGINTDLLSDKTLSKDMRHQAADHLRKVLAEEARRSGLTFITCFTKHEKLKKNLLEKGFQEIDSQLFQLGRKLWPYQV